MAFMQSSGAFTGLTNTDLRPRRRRRPVPLLDTSWPIRRDARKRRKGEPMRKDITALVDTLRTSVAEIAASQRDDRDELLTKSLGEFNATLLAKLEPVLPSEDEPLEKGMNHIALFAGVLRDAANRVHAMKTGQPRWMVSDGGADGAQESLPDDVEAMLDNFVHVGVLALQAMVNDTATLPEDDDALTRAEKAGELAKIETLDGGELLVKTALPEAYHGWLTDPLDLVVGYADAARSMTDRAIGLAEPMAEAGALPEDLVKAYPELFEPDALAKATDEDVGTGGDPNAAADPGSDQDGGDDETDDAPNNPIEMIARLCSICVVIAGSLLQNAGQSTDDGTVDLNAGGSPGQMADQPNALARSAPSDMTLAKIYAGEVEVDPALADALESLEDLRKQAAQFEQQTSELTATKSQLGKLEETVQRLSQMAAAPKGALNTVALGKNQDSGLPTPDLDQRVSRIAEMAKTNPEAAAREMVKAVHGGGGRPLLDMSGTH